jgi:hypothetical protein
MYADEELEGLIYSLERLTAFLDKSQYTETIGLSMHPNPYCFYNQFFVVFSYLIIQDIFN